MSDSQGSLFAEIVVRQLRDKEDRRVLIVAPSEERARTLFNLVAERLGPEEQGLLSNIEVEYPR